MDSHMEGEYQIHDAAATEIAMGDFLWGLTRMLRPRLVVETGTYLGYGAAALGKACAANGKGRVVTCDINQGYVDEARGRCQGLPVEVRCCSSMELEELGRADLVFLDSDYDNRPGEYAMVGAGALVVVHDTSDYSQRYSSRSGKFHLGEWCREQGLLVVDAGRGFAIGRKV